MNPTGAPATPPIAEPVVIDADEALAHVPAQRPEPRPANPLAGHPLALVTGASSGIGERVALRLAERGHATVLLARRADRLTGVRDAAARSTPSAFRTVDLTDPDDTRIAVADAIESYGAPDVVVNCAGEGLYAPFDQQSRADHERLMQLNFHAPAEIIRQVLPGMTRRGSGLVVNVASISVKMAPWGHAAYTASKAALVALTQTLAAEHADTGIRFTYVHPGIVATDYFNEPDRAELWRRVRRHAISPDRVARAIIGLLDRHRLELCVPRHYRIIDLIKAVSVRAAHRLITRQSRPRK